MLPDGQLMAFVSTTDLDRAREFYADMLGLTAMISSMKMICL